MTVLVVRRVKPGVRGGFRRWMIEVAPGIFVGSLSARVRDAVWARACALRGKGACALVYAARNEQGFALRSDGDDRYRVIDVDGLFLMRQVARRAAP